MEAGEAALAVDVDPLEAVVVVEAGEAVEEATAVVAEEEVAVVDVGAAVEAVVVVEELERQPNMSLNLIDLKEFSLLAYLLISF